MNDGDVYMNQKVISLRIIQVEIDKLIKMFKKEDKDKPIEEGKKI